MSNQFKKDVQREVESYYDGLIHLIAKGYAFEDIEKAHMNYWQVGDADGLVEHIIEIYPEVAVQIWGEDESG